MGDDMILDDVWLELAFEVDFDYTPEQKQTWDDPHIPEEITINSVEIGGIDIMPSLTLKELDEVLMYIEESRNHD